MQEQPFDINLLCAKLEIAKQEQDARQKNSRQSLEVSQTAASNRHSIIIPGSDSRTKVQWTEELKKRPQSDSQKTGQPKVLVKPLKHSKSRSEAVRDSAYFDALTFDTTQHIDSRRSSTGDLDFARPQLKDVSNRQSMDISSNLDSSPKDTSKRRSRTFPLFSRTTPKQRPMSAYGNSYTSDRKSSYDDSPESPMGLVNEYTISYDLADIIKEEYVQRPKRARRRDSIEKPELSSGMRSRSLLNLNALLKKERTEVRTEEIAEIVLEDIPEHGRPLTTANGHHARQKSLPIDLNQVIRPVSRTGERERKRSSFVAFFKKFS